MNLDRPNVSRTIWWKREEGGNLTVNGEVGERKQKRKKREKKKTLLDHTALFIFYNF